MDVKTLNTHIEGWMRAMIFYQIGIGLTVTVMLMILMVWVVFEIIHIRRRKELSIERQKHQMDGVKAFQKANEINNNKNNSEKPMDKPLLQRVVINNMNKNYQLSQTYIKMNKFKQNDGHMAKIDEASDSEQDDLMPKKSSIEV